MAAELVFCSKNGLKKDLKNVKTEKTPATL
jgi:hypothetical protein